MMFTLAQVTHIHDTLGNEDSLPEYLRALAAVGVQHYDSFITDGHSEYYGQDGHKVVSPAVHEVFQVSDTSDKAAFLDYMKLVEQGGIGYEEMSRRLAEIGVEKWAFDTQALTIAYYDKAGQVLLAENLAA
jgi:uncharacterized protein YbcV (DUF1398 family)